MPVSGLVLTLRDDSQERDEALARLAEEPRITMGVLQANRLAFVIETESDDEDRQIWSWVNSLPGVTLVDVVFVGFEQESAEERGKFGP